MKDFCDVRASGEDREWRVPFGGIDQLCTVPCAVVCWFSEGQYVKVNMNVGEHTMQWW